MPSKRPRRVLVSHWAAMIYGDYAPSRYALQLWIKRGMIQPPPERVQGRWMVVPTAQYKEP